GPADIYRDEITVSPVLTTGTWTHIAATFDVATQQIRIYVNGAETPLSTEVGQTVNPISDSTTPVLIGAIKPNTPFGFWKGLIDEPSLYSRALTADEIRAIFNARSA